MGLNKAYELQGHEIHSTFAMILTHYGFIGLSYSATIFIDGNPNIGFQIKNPITDEILTIKNEIGEIIIFGCEVFHRSLKNFDDTSRKVIGMTIHDFSVTSAKIILKNCCLNERINDSILLDDWSKINIS